MALDPSIITGIRGPAPMPAFDPMEAMGQAQAFQVRKLAIEKAQRDAAAQARMQQLAQQYGDDQDELVRQLGREFPEQAADIGKKLWDSRKSAAQAHTEQVKADREQVVAGMQMILGSDATNYPIRRSMAIRSAGEQGEMVARVLPEQYPGPDGLLQALQPFREMKDYFTSTEKANELLQKGETQKAIAEHYAGSLNKAQWDNTTENWNGLGLGKYAQTFGEYSPENVARARRLALGTKGAAELQLSAVDDARQALAAAETGRHNLAMEGTAAASAARMAQATAETARHHRAIESHQAATLAKAEKEAKEKGKTGPDVGAIFTEIETLSDRINTSEGGLMSNVRGYYRKTKAAGNFDNDVSEYESLVNGMIPMVARAVGHTGVLTQQDVDSVRELFPKVTDNKTLADNKLVRVKALIGAKPGAAPAAPKAAPKAESKPKADPLGIR